MIELFEMVAVAILFLIPAWRIFIRAGFAPATALVVVIPFIGPLIAMAILAFAEWPAHKGTGNSDAGGA